MSDPRLAQIDARVREYLGGGGLFNPELAKHDAVRDLIVDLRDALADAEDRFQRTNVALGESYIRANGMIADIERLKSALADARQARDAQEPW